jgi:outer membrane lipoprotein-sorting protein
MDSRFHSREPARCRGRSGWSFCTDRRCTDDLQDEETSSGKFSGVEMMNSRSYLTLLLLSLPIFGCGAVKERQVLTVPPAYTAAKAASFEDLISLINGRYAGIERMVVSKLEVEFTGGSVEEGYFEKYRKAKGYLVARRPDAIFVNIVNPLTSSSVLVMASKDGRFQIWIPSRNQFVTGMTEIKADEDNPVYNVRPSHILEGILVDQVPQGQGYMYYVEESQDSEYKYYVMGVFSVSPGTSLLKLDRRIWIERSTMQIRRQQFFRDSEVESDVKYQNPVEIDGKLISTVVRINRPLDRYSIAFFLESESIQLNREVKDSAFVLDPPPGAERIEVTGAHQEDVR